MYPKSILLFIIGFSLTLLLLFYLSEEKKTNPSFCFWKTKLSISSNELKQMEKLEVNHIYLRLFDVDWNSFEKEALPVGTISNWWDGNIGNQQITPSIYITNSVMKNLNKKQLDTLAIKIKTRINTIIKKHSEEFGQSKLWELENKGYENNLNRDSLQKIVDSLSIIEQHNFQKKINDILIDCDWTIETKDNYFYFLSRLKKQFPQYSISATIRLWQFKNRKLAGIPPADRGLLMCYNTSNPTEYNSENAIASLNQIQQYYTNKTYPIKLDVALPLFSWGVIYRNQKFKGLLSDVNIKDFIADTITYQQIKPTIFKYKNDMVIGNQYIRYGDEIKIESLTYKELEEITKSINENIKLTNDCRITFFSWDTTEINKHGIDKIKNLYQLFNN